MGHSSPREPVHSGDHRVSKRHGLSSKETHAERIPGTPTAMPTPDATATVTAVPTKAYGHWLPALCDGCDEEAGEGDVGSGENDGWT